MILPMKSLRWFGVIVLCADLNVVVAGELELFTENNAPNNYLAPDGKTVVGNATERVQSAMSMAGISYRLKLTEWSRALNSAMRQSNACVYSAARLPEREHSLQWLGPIAQTSWYLWGLADSPKVASLDAVRGKIVCAKISTAPGRVLSSLGQTVLPAQSGEICAQHVLRGEAEYWAANMQQTKLILAEMGAKDKIVPVLEFQRTGLYLACNLAVPKETVEKLRNAFQAEARGHP